jgi:hypothetical protein
VRCMKDAHAVCARLIQACVCSAQPRSYEAPPGEEGPTSCAVSAAEHRPCSTAAAHSAPSSLHSTRPRRAARPAASHTGGV